ncbi:MAG: acylphosphatase [Flavobacteriales bacterium]
MERVHYDIDVTGTVQGVWYRRTAVEQATGLGLVGYAMNLPDGSVHLEAEGPREALDRFVAWCRIGPPRARVHQVAVREGALVHFNVFETRR